MSKPFKGYESPLRGAMSELSSGMSALNMEPKPIENLVKDDDFHGYLSEVDAWVKHAMEHLQEAFELLTKVKEKTD